MMDFRFDAQEVEKVITNIDMFGSEIARCKNELLKVIGNKKEWKDAQAGAFDNNVNMLAGDLNRVLEKQNNYVNVLKNKVKEMTE